MLEILLEMLDMFIVNNDPIMIPACEAVSHEHVSNEYYLLGSSDDISSIKYDYTVSSHDQLSIEFIS